MPSKPEVGGGVIVAAKQTDAVAVKAYLTAKTGIQAAMLNKERWATPDEIIASVVKLHRGTLEGYKASGLGQVNL